MDDYSRKFILTKLVCYKCGKNLNVSTETPKRSDHEKDEPTGAYRAEILVKVHPCESCLKPAKDIMDAIKVIQNIKD